MGISQEIVDKIVSRILAVSKPDRIILFGSAANNAMTPDSDIDLLVVNKNTKHPREESVKIRSRLGNIGYPIDIFVMSLDWFDRTKDLIGGLAYPANKTGKVIYAQSQKP